MTGVTYQKTQRATLILSLVLLAFLGFVFAATASSPLVWIVGLVLAVIAYLFSSLTIRVDEELVQWHFGPGFLRKSISLAEIASVESVRNKWWYGWGIRYTAHGWLYNVSGLDAVQLRLTSGRAVRLGTDEPARLCQAIQTSRGEA